MENETRPTQNIPEYDFNIIEIIKEGFRHLDGVKGIFIAAFILYLVTAVVLQVILAMVFPTGTPEVPNLLNQQIVTILAYPVLMPLMVGIIMMAINYSRGENIEFKSIFNYYHIMGKLALAGILIYVMTIIGFVLLVLPGIYLSIAYVFTLPLIADKGMDVWEAMELSRKTVTKHWFKVFGLLFLLSLIFLAGIMTFGIGLIWAVPLLFLTLYGLLYRSIFDEFEA